MNKVKHGIAIGIERIDETLYVSMKAYGKLTHHDYTAFAPLLEGALGSIESPGIRLIFDASEFSGWELRAAWDDFKTGLRHGNEFSKVAIVGRANWQAVMAAVGKWFIDGQVNYFTDKQLALNWL